MNDQAIRVAGLTLVSALAFCTPGERQAANTAATVTTIGCKIVQLVDPSGTTQKICATEEEIAALLPAVEAIFADRMAADAGAPTGGALRRLRSCRP